MPYRPPELNLLANVWLCDLTIRPADGVPDYENIPCQKYVASRAAWPVTPPSSDLFFTKYAPPVQLRFARAGLFSGPWTVWKVVCAEVPAGSGQYYRVLWQDIQHEGFVNEYALLVAAQCDADLFAFPPAGGEELTGIGADACGGVPPPGPGFLDTFVDTANLELSLHTTDSGHHWSSASGEMDIGPAGVACFANLTPGGQTYYLNSYADDVPTYYALDFTTPSDLTNGMHLGLIFRPDSPTDWLAVALTWDSVSAFTLNLWQNVAGSLSILVTGTISNVLSIDTDYTLRVEVSGSAITAFLIQGATTLDTQNSTSSSGIGNPQSGVWQYVDGTYPSVQMNAMSSD